jgi:hypothetical protein
MGLEFLLRVALKDENLSAHSACAFRSLVPRLHSAYASAVAVRL